MSNPADFCLTSAGYPLQTGTWCAIMKLTDQTVKRIDEESTRRTLWPREGPHRLKKPPKSAAWKFTSERPMPTALERPSSVGRIFAPLQASEVPRPLKDSCGVEFGWYRGAYQWLRPFRVSERDGAFFFALPRKVRKEQH